MTLEGLGVSGRGRDRGRLRVVLATSAERNFDKNTTQTRSHMKLQIFDSDKDASHVAGLSAVEWLCDSVHTGFTYHSEITNMWGAREVT